MNSAVRSKYENKIKRLESENRLLKERNKMQKDEMDRLRSHIEWLSRQVFGAKSEKSRRVLQDGCLISLFDEKGIKEAEPAAPQEEEEPQQTVKEHTRHKRTKPDIEELKKTLEVKNVVIPMPEEEKTCPECGKAMQPMGREFVRYELVREQPRIYIRAIHRETYVCKDESHEKPAFAKSCVPPSVIAHSLASASTVAYVMEQRYRYAKTFYRMEQEWHDLGVDISRQTMSNWVMLAANEWLQPILDRMKPVLLSREIVHADETTFPLLPEKGSDRHRTESCFAWVYTTGSYEQEVRMAIYVYQPGRGGKYAEEFLKGYHGILQTDGYAGYNGVKAVLRALCWAHARRRFVDALPKPERKTPEKSSRVAGEAIRKIAELFKIDKALSGLSPEERSRERLQREKPVLEALKAWLLEKQHLMVPNSKLAEAVNYVINNWEGLTNYLKDGRCSLTNNICERTIRPFTIGRKNWLFSGSENGARASAAAYSIAETCSLNEVNFYEYLQLVFNEVPGLDFHRQPELLDKYLPWSEYVKENCK